MLSSSNRRWAWRQQTAVQRSLLPSLEKCNQPIRKEETGLLGKAALERRGLWCGVIVSAMLRISAAQPGQTGNQQRPGYIVVHLQGGEVQEYV